MLIPTPRLLFLALCGVPVVGFTGSYSSAAFVAGLWGAALLLLVVIDTVSLPPFSQLAWRREHDAKLSQAAWNAVTLTLHNSSDRKIQLRARDAVPPQLRAEGETLEGVCAVGEAWTARYRVLPLRRGDYQFGPLTVRYLAPLGLVWRQRREHPEGAFKVYPNLLAVRTYEILLRRGQLQEMGLRSSRRWGEGSEFERLREYSPDDEYRRINWPATARRHTPITADYETERSQNIMLALDTGRLMSTRLPIPGSDTAQDEPMPGPSDVSSAGVSLSRLDYAVNAALLLSFAAQRSGDRVGLLAFDDRVTRFLPPRPGRRQFLAVTEALYNLEPTATEPDYGEAFTYLALRHRRRSLIVLFTDVTEPDAASGLVSHLARVARRHLALVVTLSDPEIARLASQSVFSSESVYRRAVGRMVLDGREQALAELRRRGALTVDVRADQISAAVINRYLEIKARSVL